VWELILRSVKKQKALNQTFNKPSKRVTLAQTVIDDVESDDYAHDYQSNMQDYLFLEEDINTMTRDAVLHSRIVRKHNL
jgi:hypothetical protein